MQNTNFQNSLKSVSPKNMKLCGSQHGARFMVESSTMLPTMKISDECKFDLRQYLLEDKRKFKSGRRNCYLLSVS